MNKLLVLGVALVLAVIATVWFVLGGSGDPPPAAGAPGASETHTEATPAAGATDETVTAPPQEPTATETEAAPEPSDQRSAASLQRVEASFPTADALWLDVELHTPAGAPAEEDAGLLVLATTLRGTDEVHSHLIESWLRELHMGGTFRESSQEFFRDSENFYWSRHALQPSMRLPLPEGTQHASVVLQSRYQYLEPQLVALDEPLVLRPQLGAFVSGECVLPPGGAERLGDESIEFYLAAQKDESAFAVYGIWGGNDVRNVELGKDRLAFELRAIPAESAYMGMAQTSALVGTVHEQFELAPGEHRHLQLEFQLGATIRGRVLGQRGGEPIAGADVLVQTIGAGMMFASVPSTTTADDGTFELLAVPPGKGQLLVQIDGWIEPEPLAIELTDGEVLEDVLFELDAGGSCSGQVVWSDGEPAAGAHVQASILQAYGWIEEVSSTEAAADGTFHLQGLGETETYRIHARAELDRTNAERLGESWKPLNVDAALVDPDEWEPSERDHDGSATRWNAVVSDVPSGASGLVLTLEPPLPVRGMVVDDTGAVVREFQVQALPRGALMAYGDSAADEFTSDDGSFEIEVPYPAEWQLDVSAPGLHVQGEPPLVRAPQVGGPIVVELARGGAIAGLVLDPSGNPIEEAAVQIDNAGMIVSDMEQSSTTGADGRFTIEGVASRRPELVASHPDWARSAAVVVELEPGSEQDDVVLQLRAGALITGQVFDEDGAPEAGRKVSCGRNAAIGFGGGEHHTTTDADGNFRLERVTPGKVTVAAGPSEQELMELMAGNDEAAMLNAMGQVLMETVEVQDGEEVHVVLGAEPKLPVRVHGVVTEAGAPLADTGVFVFAEGAAILQGLKAEKTDASGRFEVVVDRPGDYVFGASPGGMGGPEASFFVTVPEVEALRYDLELPVGRISGRVFGPDGEAAAGSLVRIERAGGMRGIADISESTTDYVSESGDFSFERLRAGTYEILAGGSAGPFSVGSPSDFGAMVVAGIELDAGGSIDGIEIRLEAAGTLTGTVRDSAGQPVAGAAIYARDAAGRNLSTITSCVSDAAGSFTYEGLPPGTLTVFARSADFATRDSVAVEISAGGSSAVELVVDEAGWLVVSITREGEPVRAQLEVLDADGRRVSGLISADALEQLFAEGLSSKVRRIGPLPPGAYTLTATTDATEDGEGARARKKVTLRPGRKERDVKLRLD